ncbi:MAG: ZIP family metal transporter [Candidatus Odinarchaeota archaeon]
MDIEPVFFAAIAFFSTFSGGLVALKFKDKFGILAAFVSGVLIAVSFFDLIPESLTLSEQLHLPVTNVMHMVAIGFVFLFILERYFSVHRICDEDGCENVRHQSGGVIGALELSAHSFMDGFAIGTGFLIDFQVGIIIAVAVIAHDFSDGLNTVTVMINSGNSVKSSLRLLLLDAVTPVLGALTAMILVVSEEYLIIILPFFAGGFLYLGASDLLPEAHEINPPIVTLVAFLAGFSFIFVVLQFLTL